MSIILNNYVGILFGILITLFCFALYMGKGIKKNKVIIYAYGLIICQSIFLVYILLFQFMIIGNSYLFVFYDHLRPFVRFLFVLFSILYIDSLFNKNQPNTRLFTVAFIAAFLLLLYNFMPEKFITKDRIQRSVENVFDILWQILLLYIVIINNKKKLHEVAYLIFGTTIFLITNLIAMIDPDNFGGSMFIYGYLILFISITCMVLKKYHSAYKQTEYLSQNLSYEVQVQTSQILQQKNELELINKKLVDSDRLKTEFFQNITHELRTPLTLILGPVDSILKKNDETRSDVRNSLHTIKRNANDLLVFVNKILDITKMDAGKMQTHFEKIDIISVCTAVANNYNEIAKENNISYKIEFPGNSLPVVTDKYKIECILNNLISNAFKYTANGGEIRIKIDYVDTEENYFKVPPEVVKIRIKDTGIGIAEEDLTKIFERFRLTGGSTSSRFGVTGIGLALVKEYLKLLKGELNIQSELGKGSEFTVSLPIDAENHIDNETGTSDINKNHLKTPLDSKINAPFQTVGGTVADSEKSEIPDRFIDCAYDHKKNVVFVLDDNVELLVFIKKNLEFRYNVFGAVNGIRGLEKIKTLPRTPDLIISDIMMPNMDGFEFFEKLRSDFKFLYVPFIFLTAKMDSRLKGLALGAVDYIGKPFIIDELINKVESLLRLQVHYENSVKKNVGDRITAAINDDKDAAEDESLFKERCRQYSITERESEIIKLLQRGSTDKLIANELSISPNTVNAHLKNIYKKLNVTSRFELINRFS